MSGVPLAQIAEAHLNLLKRGDAHFAVLHDRREPVQVHGQSTAPIGEGDLKRIKCRLRELGLACKHSMHAVDIPVTGQHWRAAQCAVGAKLPRSGRYLNALVPLHIHLGGVAGAMEGWPVCGPT